MKSQELRHRLVEIIARWDILLHGSVINRFLRDVRDASVHVVPLEKVKTNGVELD
jgi:hypothetical protein